MMVRRSLVVVASAALAGLVVLLAALLVRSGRNNPLAELAAAVGGSLDIDARLTGGFEPPAKAATARRGSRADTDRLSPDARIAVANLEKRLTVDRSPKAVAAVAVAHLVEGDVDRAMRALEEVTSASDDASPWSDLSAAYLVKAEHTPERRIEYLARAVDAASRSLRVRPTNEARFNRALAVHRLSPYVGDAQPWNEYLAVETDRRWIAAAKRQAVDQLHSVEPRNDWNERKRALRDRIDARDRTSINAAVAVAPEGALEFFDQELLADWARAQISDNASGADFALARAEELAIVWSSATGDPLPRDTIRHLRSRARRPDALRALAQAHLAYCDTIVRYRGDDYNGAQGAISAALDVMKREESPFRWWAALQQATILFQLRQLDQSDAILASAMEFARSRGYTTLQGRALRQRGLNLSKQWQIDSALTAFEEAAHDFERAGEREDAVTVYSLIAANRRMLGDHHASWEFIGKTLDGISHVRMPLRRYLALYNASLFASSQDLFDAALLFQNAAIQEAISRGRGPVVEALIERATIFSRKNDDTRAFEDLREAQTRLNALADGPLKRYHQAEIDVLAADLSQKAQIEPNIDGLQQAIRFFSTAEPVLVPRLNLALARAQLRNRHDDEAASAFEGGVRALEQQQAKIGDEAFKISYFDEAWSLFPEVIQFQVDIRHDVERAFDYSERSRARSLLDSSMSMVQPMTLAAVERALPESVLLLYSVMLSDRVLVWTVTRGGHRLSEWHIARDEVVRLATRFHAALAGGNEATAAGTALYDLLLGPAGTLTPGTTIVFVTDGVLQQLPFAALRHSASGHYVVEDHAIVVAPSATLFVAGLSKGRQLAWRAPESALLVGNPAGDAARDLPGSQAEVTAAAAMYRRHLVLTGRAATKDRFLRSAADYDVVHFGGHAITNVEYPLMSRLLFSPDSGVGAQEPLFAYEIARIRLPRAHVVVLAACSTGAGAVSRGEGVVSIARPFLAAGAPVVIASQWDVDDRATETLFREFHRALAETHDPIGALRIAQLSLLHDPSRANAAPANWAAFVALGTISR